MAFKVFNDPIHKLIKIPPLCVKIIDTPQFQRLRFIKQLGGTYFVFPGAAHNRFEHSLGVCYLAGKLALTLKERQDDLHITDNDVLCVQIAGLCHDLGQGPLSRMFENKFLPMVDETITHEHLSLLMFNRMVDENGLEAEFTKYELDENDLTFIREQIKGPPETEVREWQYKGRTQKKAFLYEIVANKRNGIDVDKWDYFARDCQMLGIQSSFQYRRCMESVKVLNFCTETQLCFGEKEDKDVFEMFQTRYTLHEKAYKHRVGDIIETMIAEALWKANDIFMIAGKNGKKLKISETIKDMEAYEKMTDSIIENILQSDDSNLKESKEILRRVQKRKLYKFVGEMDPKKSTNTASELKEYIKEEKEGYHKRLLEKDDSWKTDDFIIHCVSLDFGMEDKHPMNHVCFYNKEGVPFKYTKDEVSNKFHCQSSQKKVMRFFCKREDENSYKQAVSALDILKLQ